MKKPKTVYKPFYNSKGQDFQIFLDMDGVLTDFDNNFINIANNKDNLSFKDYDEKYGKHSAWALIDKEGLTWWKDMPWTKDGKKLWNTLKKYNPIILSAPSRHSNSAKGKVMWVNRELGLNIKEATRSPKNHRWDKGSRMILNSEKYLFSKRYPNSILIDDTPKKINAWREKGGIGILHKNTETTLSELNDILQELENEQFILQKYIDFIKTK